MPKRKRRSSRKRSSTSKANLSQRKYEQLRSEAEKARLAIRRALNSSDSQMYDLPDPSAYTLKNLISRIDSGDSYAALIKELKGTRRANFKRLDAVVDSEYSIVIPATGEYIEGSTVMEFKVQLNKANRAIRSARTKYGENVDILPQEFTEKELLEYITSEEGLKKLTQELKVFTPKNLVPKEFGEGVYATKAEREFLLKPIAEENIRRDKRREEEQNPEFKGFLVSQSQADISPINPGTDQTIYKLRERSYKWRDMERMIRANTFLDNYIKKLNDFEVLLRIHKMYNDEVEKRLQFIRNEIAGLYFDEEGIRIASTRIPGIDIGALYPTKEELGNAFSFSEIYNAWVAYHDHNASLRE